MNTAEMASWSIWSKKDKKAFARYVSSFAHEMADGCECPEWREVSVAVDGEPNEDRSEVRELRKLFSNGVSLEDAIVHFCDSDMTAPYDA